MVSGANTLLSSEAAPAPVVPGQVAPQAPVPVDPALRSGVLDNGLTVLMHVDGTAPQALIWLA